MKPSFVFIFYENPKINKIFPIFGPVGGGYNITLTGKHFINLTQFAHEFVCIYKTVGTKFKETSHQKAIFVNKNKILCAVPERFEAGSIVKVGISNTGGLKVYFF